MSKLFAIFGAFGLTALTCFADSLFAHPRPQPEAIRLLTPEVRDFMKSADSVSVFHADLSKKPSEAGYEINLRQINGEERSQLVYILLDPTNYYQGLYCIIDSSDHLGIEFRKKDKKLVLTCGTMLIDGNFCGRPVSGAFAISGEQLLQQWRQEYDNPK